MPAKIAILYPSIVMALMTLCVILALGARRLAAVRARQVHPKYYVTFSGENPEPQSLKQHSRHVNNHFEVPPLFHIAAWGTYLVGEVTTTAVALAWFFVASRAIHSLIHLTYNTVIHRFFVYGLGVIATLVLWIHLAMSLGHA